MTFGSLFAGIGGMDLGLERAGMTCAWQVEINPYCQRVLAKHWPDVRRWDDVRTFPPAGDWGCDLICGGFPCQDISVAGKGAGLEGERSGLWAEYARIVRVIRPRFVVVENSPALVYRGLGRVLSDLAGIGFDAEWSVLSACRMGAPHMRRRVFIVAYDAKIRQLWNRQQNPRAARNDWWRMLKSKRTNWGAAEPDVGRVADGVSVELDKNRIAAIGNAVVPQVAEWIGKRIMELNRDDPLPDSASPGTSPAANVLAVPPRNDDAARVCMV